MRGMHCGGCAANVRKTLEADGSVVSALVNLANESALVRIGVDVPADESNDVPTPQTTTTTFEDKVVAAVRAVGEKLASAVTERVSPRPSGRLARAVSNVSATDAALSKREDRLRRIRESTKRVAVAWALAATCLIGHVGAASIRGAAPRRSVFCSTPVHAGLSVFASVGPGREIFVDGWRF